MNKLHVSILAAILTLLGFGIFSYKAFYLGFPLRPSDQTDAWVVEAHATFTGRNKPVKLEVLIPKNSHQFLIMDESFISRGFGLTTQDKQENRQAVWSIRRALGRQNLYYRALVRRNTLSSAPPKYKTPGLSASGYEGALLEAAKALVEEMRSKSADMESFVSRLIASIDATPGDPNVKLLLGRKFSSFKKVETAARVLAVALIPARVVHGIRLDRSTRYVEITYRLEVFDEGTWKSFDWQSRDLGASDDFLPWWRGTDPLVQIKGGDHADVKISVERYQEGAMAGVLEGSDPANPGLTSISLFHLPLEVQSIYRVLLLVPLGGFIVALIRSVIGLRTFGTFMPVLIALAFRETQLGWGIVLFSTLVALGLMFRFYFEHLKLMLVPRLAAILTVVVLLMALVSLLTHKLGLMLGLSVALFPMVIVTMTIERMSTVWDELGAQHALRQGCSSLLCAAVVYLIITVKAVEHLVFTFPELLLVLLAACLMLGRYTGYRLLEYLRFRALLKVGE
ncbi:MAG: inactive transglutaminase family protein [Deltaproteobacteria bacterium]|nr:inactive transglutaminase family protein [Deltaproteobacteria bacterium]